MRTFFYYVLWWKNLILLFKKTTSKIFINSNFKKINSNIWWIKPNVWDEYNHRIWSHLSLTQCNRRFAIDFVRATEIIYISEVCSFIKKKNLYVELILINHTVKFDLKPWLRFEFGWRESDSFYFENTIDQTTFGENKTTFSVNTIMVFLKKIWGVYY